MNSNIKGGIRAKGIGKQGHEANVWAQEGCEWGVYKGSELETPYFLPYLE
jgi:hypothetical protein